MTYEEYIASPPWRRLRRQALARDGHRCRTCNTAEQLEAHHRSYPSTWDRDCLENLTTLCHDCHEVITAHPRRKRYEKYVPPVVSVTRVTPRAVVKEVKPHEIRVPDVQDSRYGSFVDAQLAIGRSEERHRQEIEESLRQARQDGCRSRRDG